MLACAPDDLNGGFMIAILDFGLGNVGSIQNMLVRIGVNKDDIILAREPKDLDDVNKIILPGVGNFDAGMKMFLESGMKERVDDIVLEEKKPILGICLGMQMLGINSEEGEMQGLGYMPFSCRRFCFKDSLLKIPHMGWDYVKVIDKNNPLVKGLPDKSRFYFVHSYYAVCEKKEDILLTCDYSFEFTAAVNYKNVYGTQFHPEKSHKYGMLLLKNFVEVI